MNCVGYNNYKAFIFFVMQVWILSLGVCVTYIAPLVNVYKNRSTSLMLCYLVSVEYGVCSSIFFAISYFLLFHLWLISKAYTTQEYNYIYLRDTDNKPRSPYNINFCTNLKNVFGSNYISWLFPCGINIS